MWEIVSKTFLLFMMYFSLHLFDIWYLYPVLKTSGNLSENIFTLTETDIENHIDKITMGVNDLGLG